MSQHDHDIGALPLTKRQLAIITAACSQHHVLRLFLFGSLLRPDYRPGQSDVQADIDPTKLTACNARRAEP